MESPLIFPHLPRILTSSFDQINSQTISDPKEMALIVNQMVQVATATYSDRDPQFDQVLLRVSKALVKTWAVHEEALFQKICFTGSSGFTAVEPIIQQVETAIEKAQATILAAKVRYTEAVQMVDPIVCFANVTPIEAMQILKDTYESPVSAVWLEIETVFCLFEKIRTDFLS
jgi:hypothetical protein